jgi:signal transduction histidine kinase
MSDGNPLAAAHDVSLPAGSRNVEIHFTGFWFSSPEKIRFRYRLEGLDPAWIPDNGTRTARYNRIPPGTQRFLVSASLPGGTWSEPPAMLVLRQMPLFYQTRWFLLLIALAAIAVIIGLFRWRIHIIKMRYAVVTTERNRIAREWHDTLVAGFSAISLQLDAALLRLGERQDRVRELLEVTRKMVHHYRAEARRVIWDLRDTRPDSESFVDAVSSTLRRATEGKEIHGTMSVVGEPVSAPKDVELNLVRICQEALSNAVRHGQPEHLRLEVQYQPDLLKLRIEDDGGGFEPARMNGLNTGHFGLTVMQERARRFGGDFTLNSRPGRGTVIEATIPLRGSGAK